jgi:DNA (cytosine-5)-methyltransferase 1
MNHISLFSGIGGFDLASEWMGWNNIASCEINPFGRKVLNHYWPDALHHDDVHTFTKKLLNEKIKNWNSKDVILSGGFPCQPYSQAGKRKGKEDERHLWPEMLRIIREIRPRWIVGENVRGLTNWNGGLVFDEIHFDLETLGYEVQSFILPACSKNAPHRRDRIWIVAHTNDTNTGSNNRGNGRTAKEIRREKTGNVFGTLCDVGNVTDTKRNGRNGSKRSREGGMDGKILETTERNEKTNESNGRDKIANATDTASERRDKNNGKRKSRFVDEKSKANNWEDFPTQSPICGGNDGLPAELDGITFPKWRNESIKAYGNAVVPQVVFEIFKAIQKFNELEE